MENDLAKIKKLENLLNDENFKGDRILVSILLKRIKSKFKITSTDPYRTKQCYRGCGDVRSQKKRYEEKYAEYEKSWGGRYSNYECLLRIDPNLFL